MKPQLMAAVLGLLLASHATARDAELCGEYTSIDLGEVTVDMGRKSTFMHFRSSTQLHTSEGSKYNALTGQCTGGAMVYPDGSVEAEGLCAVEDVDGDILTYAFTQGRGAKEGKYMRRGGTGKFAGARETGWFRPVKLNGDITTGQWGGKGACK